MTRHGTTSCRAHKRSGDPCENGPIAGGFTCRMHGSSTAAARRNAEKRRVMSFTEGKIAQLLKECDIPEQHPLDGLLEAVRHSGAMFRMLAGLVGELETHPGEEEWAVDEEGDVRVRRARALYGPDSRGEAAPNVLLVLYGQWQDRYARACKLALDADIDERLVRNAEATSEAMYSAVGRALDAAALTGEQATAFKTALATELRRLTGPMAGELE